MACIAAFMSMFTYKEPTGTVWQTKLNFLESAFRGWYKRCFKINPLTRGCKHQLNVFEPLLPIPSLAAIPLIVQHN